MAIKFRRQANKFVEKADPETIRRIREQLNQLLSALEERSLIPFTELDIKQMKGDWEGFYRLRVGKRMSEKFQRFLHLPPTPQFWGTFEPTLLQNPPILGDLGGGSDGNLDFSDIL